MAVVTSAARPPLPPAARRVSSLRGTLTSVFRGQFLIRCGGRTSLSSTTLVSRNCTTAGGFVALARGGGSVALVRRGGGGGSGVGGVCGGDVFCRSVDTLSRLLSLLDGTATASSIAIALPLSTGLMTSCDAARVVWAAVLARSVLRRCCCVTVVDRNGACGVGGGARVRGTRVRGAALLRRCGTLVFGGRRRLFSLLRRIERRLMHSCAAVSFSASSNIIRPLTILGPNPQSTTREKPSCTCCKCRAWRLTMDSRR